MRTMRQLSGITAAIAAMAIVITGCGISAGNKAGGPTQGPAPLRLTAANVFGLIAVQGFADAVDALSKGSIKIDITSEVGGGGTDSEAKAIDQVRSGQADLGMVGSRAWTSAGVTSYDALIAPFLVDSYELERRVLESRLVDEMGAGLEPLGLVGIGVMPGDLRALLSKTRPFRTPADFAGASVAGSKSVVSEMTFRALGATTPAFTEPDSIALFDAYEGPVVGMFGNGYDKVGRFVTANVRFWPRPIVVFMSKNAFTKLTGEQQTLLRSAVRNAIGGTLEQVMVDERDSADILCRNGVQFSEASAQERAALRSAVEPVFAELERDQLTKRLIDGIEQMKSAVAQIDQPIVCGPSPSPSPAASQVTPLDGTWEACLTEQDILAAGGIGDDGKYNDGCTTFGFHGGEFTFSLAATANHQSESCTPCGTYLLTGDRIKIELSNGEVFDFTWSVFKDTLTFKKSAVSGSISPAPWLAKPFRRTGN